MVEIQIFSIQLFDLQLRLRNLPYNVIKNLPKLINSMQSLHQIGFDIMALKHHILFISLWHIKLAANAGRLRLLAPNLKLHVPILSPGPLQIVLHGLVGHVDLVLLVGNSIDPIIVGLEPLEVVYQVLSIPPQLVEVRAHTVQPSLKWGIVHHHGLDAVDVKFVTDLGAGSGDWVTKDGSGWWNARWKWASRYSGGGQWRWTDWTHAGWHWDCSQGDLVW